MLEKKMRAWPVVEKCASARRLHPRNDEVCMALMHISSWEPPWGGVFSALFSKHVHVLRAKPALQMEYSEVTGLQLQTKQTNVFSKAILIYLFFTRSWFILFEWNGCYFCLCSVWTCFNRGLVSSGRCKESAYRVRQWKEPAGREQNLNTLWDNKYI